MAIIKNPITVMQSGGGGLDEFLEGTTTELTSGATSVRANVCQNLTALESASLPNATSIGAYAFDGCAYLTTINIPSVATIGNYAFRNCSALTTISLPSVTSMGDYAFQNCVALTSVVGTMPQTVPQYCFSGCINLESIDFSNVQVFSASSFYNCKKLVGTLALTSSQQEGANSFTYTGYSKITGTIYPYGNSGGTFDYMNDLEEVDVIIRGQFSYLFNGCSKLTNVKVHPYDSNTAFATWGQSIGVSRSNPSANRMKLDIREFTATTSLPTYYIGSSSNSGTNTQYTDLFFPSSITTVNNYCFYYNTGNHLYFTSATPPTLNSNSFYQQYGDFKVYVPYNSVNTYKTATNWATYASNIRAYAEENTFENGQTLPLYNDEGCATTWYSDIGMTQQITTVSDKTQILYCQVATTQTVGKIIFTDVEDTTLTITDGTNTYQENDFVPLNTVLTITATPTSNNVLYNVFVDGNAFTNGGSHTVAGNFNIVAISGENITTTLQNTSWSNIQKLAKGGIINTKFNIGDEKTITDTNNNVWTVFITDMQANRYKYANKNMGTHVVFEFKETTSGAVNLWNNTSQRYPTCNMHKNVLPTFLNTLTDIKDVIEEYEITSANSTTYTDSTMIKISTKLCLPAYYERLYGGTDTRYVKETKSTFNGNNYGTFDYYLNTSSSDAKFNKPIVNTTTMQTYWLRTIYYNSSGNGQYFGLGQFSGSSTTTAGSFNTGGAPSYTYRFAPVFAM